MNQQIDFYFDIGSPTAQFAYGELKRIASTYKAEIAYEPMLLGAVHKATNNVSPGAVAAKGRYMLKYDLPRYAKLYGIPFIMNPHFPINTLTIMRGCFAAKKMGVFEKYLTVLFNAMWVKGLNVGVEEILRTELIENGLDADALLSLIETDDIKAELKLNTQKAVGKGCFGAPTMFVGDELFFGQDRVFFIEDMVKA